MSQNITEAIRYISELGAELGVLAAALAPVLLYIKKLANGMRCQLRSDMLCIYYKYNEKEEIPQYEYENFVALYEAYKSLKGNSFVDKIYKDIQAWDIVSRRSGA